MRPSNHPVSSARLSGVLLLCLLSACTSTKARQAEKVKVDKLISDEDAQRLQGEMWRFADVFSAKIAGTARDVAWETDSRAIREGCLRWCIAVIPTMKEAVFTQDPRAALVDAWILCEQQTRYFKKPIAEAEVLLQQSALVTCQELEAEIEEIAAEFVPEDRFEEAKGLIEGLADQHPVRRSFAGAALQAAELAADERGRGITAIFSVPISGVSEGATAIDRVARVAGVFTEMVEDMPQMLRWHLELLILEVDSLKSITESRATFSRFVDTTERMAGIVESLPANVRGEIDQAFESLNESQAELQKTIADAHVTVAEMNATVTNGRALVGDVRQVNESVQASGAAWEKTAGAVVEALAAFRETFPPDEPADPNDVPFEIKDLTEAAEQIDAAARDIHDLLRDSDSLVEAIEKVAARSETSIDHTAGQMGVIVDQLTIRGAILIGLVLGVMLLYRLVGHLLGRRVG